MRKQISKTDQGKAFGKWGDRVSKYMYVDHIQDVKNRIKIEGSIVDLGGGNGILKEHFTDVTTVDTDEDKNPDVVQDIFDYKGEHDWVILRYVLHYLDDYEVIKLFKHIRSYHEGKILVIQFVNSDLEGKYHNSRNEHKYFRTAKQLEALMPRHRILHCETYTVGPDFYMNRLKLTEDIKIHVESIHTYLI